VNLKGIWEQQDLVDSDRVYSNDIVAILMNYGVEAARAAIIKEISAVFAVYGIEVNHRHLSLIGDVMTREGGYSPFNRIGIESNASPFLKMSFETTCHFLQLAALDGSVDSLDSPSAKIVLGKVAGVGTGCFDLMTKLPNTELPGSDI